MIVIIDYGVGNLRSILTKFERMKIEACVSSQQEDIERATKLVLPGIGHFGAAMANLNHSGLVPILERKVLHDLTPLLGICVGMQLLTRGSEEGDEHGLGWVGGTTCKFSFETTSNKRLRIPHMGWNDIDIIHSTPLIQELPAEARFYFAHSYHVVVDDDASAVATTWYGRDFVSIMQQDNIMATQFHPEKSHQAGLCIIRNFARYG